MARYSTYLILGAVTAALFLMLSSARADQPSIVVHKLPVKVMKQTFDPHHLPKQMPPLVPGEAGLCHYEFTTDIQTGGDVDTIAPGQVKVTIDSVEINCSLPITIFLEPKAPQRIIEHEDGHRSVCEYYYANIDVYAKRAAEHVMGKTFVGKGKDKQSAINDAIGQAIAAINKEILDQTRVRAVACNDRYDKITDHSRNPGSQAEAASKAESADPEPPGGKPASATTQPAPPVGG
jgi:hypothetical protein